MLDIEVGQSFNYGSWSSHASRSATVRRNATHIVTPYTKRFCRLQLVTSGYDHSDTVTTGYSRLQPVTAGYKRFRSGQQLAAEPLDIH